MRFRETEIVELKSIVMDDIKKEIIAFANCEGGTVYVGVADDGKVLGVENADECALQISNMVRDAVKPDVTMFIHYETLECDGKAVVAVNIQRGTNRPYYLAKKGLRPEGVYVRQGYSSVPATDTAIRQMIKETDGDSFENMRSINQALTFEATKRNLKKEMLPLDSRKCRPCKLFPQMVFIRIWAYSCLSSVPTQSRQPCLRESIRMYLRIVGSFPAH